MGSTVFLLPGLGNSGRDHWQTRWEIRYGYHRVAQDDWDRPKRAAWMARLEAELSAVRAGVVLVAHSLGCALVSHWAREYGAGRVVGALLVAPADVDSARRTPDEVRDFSPLPMRPLPFPSIVVASTSDSYVDHDRGAYFATRWGAGFRSVGDAGHINADSRLGDWSDGHRLLTELLDELGAPQK